MKSVNKEERFCLSALTLPSRVHSSFAARFQTKKTSYLSLYFANKHAFYVYAKSLHSHEPHSSSVAIYFQQKTIPANTFKRVTVVLYTVNKYI